MNPIKALYYSRFGLFLCQCFLAGLISYGNLHAAESQTIAQKADIENIPARKLFFAKEFGKLALLPNASSETSAKSAGTFWGLNHQAIYDVKLHSHPTWFQYNNRLSGSNGKRRHLGVLIITINSSGSDKTLAAYRNANWHRPGSTNVLGEFFSSKPLSWDKFASLVTNSAIDGADVQMMDSAVGGPWHAVPIGGDEFSWDYRQFWKWAIDEFKRESEGISNNRRTSYYRISTRLIGFRPTTQTDSQKPVVFYTNATKGDTIFIATYSLQDGGQDTRSWAWLRVK